MVHISTKDCIFVFCITIISFLVHSLFVLDGFGEVDAANFAVTSLVWDHIGKPTFVSTLFRTSILYLQYLKTALALGFPAQHLDVLMNWTNVVIGSLACIPLYCFWRRLTTTGTVIIYLAMLFFAPAFWLGNIYGFPHVPAIFFFINAILFFDLFLTANSKVQFFYLGTSFLCAIIATGLKADIILCFGAFGGLVFYRKQWSRFRVASAVILPVAAFIIIFVYSRSLFPELSNSLQFASAWFRYFPFTWQAFTDPENLAASITPAGIIFSIATVLAVVYGATYKKHLDILFFIFTWALPIGLFWSARMGNSARHMLAAWIPLLFYTALMIKELKPSHRITFFIVLLSANYFVCPSTQLSRTVRPSSRIFHAKACIQERVSQWHRLGESLASMEHLKKVVAGNDLVSYLTWEILKTQPSVSYDFTNGIYIFKGCQYKELHALETELQAIEASCPGWKIMYLKTDPDNQVFNIIDLEHKPAR